MTHTQLSQGPWPAAAPVDGSCAAGMSRMACSKVLIMCLQEQQGAGVAEFRQVGAGVKQQTWHLSCCARCLSWPSASFLECAERSAAQRQ
jgi:hypothetical protein